MHLVGLMKVWEASCAAGIICRVVGGGWVDDDMVTHMSLGCWPVSVLLCGILWCLLERRLYKFDTY